MTKASKFAAWTGSGVETVHPGSRRGGRILIFTCFYLQNVEFCVAFPQECVLNCFGRIGDGGNDTSCDYNTFRTASFLMGVLVLYYF